MNISFNPIQVFAFCSIWACHSASASFCACGATGAVEVEFRLDVENPNGVSWKNKPKFTFTAKNPSSFPKGPNDVEATMESSANIWMQGGTPSGIYEVSTDFGSFASSENPTDVGVSMSLPCGIEYRFIETGSATDPDPEPSEWSTGGIIFPLAYGDPTLGGGDQIPTVSFPGGGFTSANSYYTFEVRIKQEEAGNGKTGDDAPGSPSQNGVAPGYSYPAGSNTETNQQSTTTSLAMGTFTKDARKWSAGRLVGNGDLTKLSSYTLKVSSEIDPVEMSTVTVSSTRKHFVSPEAVLDAEQQSVSGSTKVTVSAYSSSQYNSGTQSFTGAPISTYVYEDLANPSGDPDLTEGIKITEIIDGETSVKELSSNATGSKVSYKMGIRRYQTESTPLSGSPSRMEVSSVYEEVGGTEQCLSMVVEEYDYIAKRELLVTRRYDMDADPTTIPMTDPMESWIYYNYVGVPSYLQGRVFFHQSSDQSWTYYGYSSAGQTVTYRPFLNRLPDLFSQTDNVYSGGSKSGSIRTLDDGRVYVGNDLIYDSSLGGASQGIPTSSDDDVYISGDSYPYNASVVKETIGSWDGTTFLAGGEPDFDEADENDSPPNPRTHRRIVSEEGVYDLTGTSSSVSTDGDLRVVPGASKKTVDIYNENGIILEQSWIYAGSSYELVNQKTFHYDNFGRLTNVYLGNRLIQQFGYPSRYITQSWDEQGRKTEIEVDDFGRTVSVTQGNSGDTTPIVITSTQYLGLEERTLINGRHVQKDIKDRFGRVVETQDSKGRVVTVNYGISINEGGEMVTRNRPGGVGIVSENFRDGRAYKVSGNGVVETEYSYPILDFLDSNLATQKVIGTKQKTGGPGSSRTVTTASSQNGEESKTIRPAANDATKTITVHSYVTQNTQVSETYLGDLNGTKPTGASSLATYVSHPEPNATAESLRLFKMGRLSSSGMHTNGDPITLVGPGDRGYALTKTDFVFEDGEWWEQTEEKRYYEQTKAQTLVTKIALSRETGDKHKSVIGSLDGAISSTFRNFEETTTYTFNDSLSVVSRTSNIAGTSTETYSGGYLVSSTSSGSDITASYKYDGEGRLIWMKDTTGRTQESVFNETGQLVRSMNHAKEVTRYEYWPSSHPAAGRVKQMINPEGETTIYGYDSKGNVNSIDGTSQYPRTFTRNLYGEVNGMYTQKTGGGFAVTAWFYNANVAGLLEEKIFDYGSADEESVIYDYDDFGRLTQRIFERGTSGTTVYEVDDYMSLNKIDYLGDDSPSQWDVAITRDGFGRESVVTERYEDASGTYLGRATTSHAYTGSGEYDYILYDSIEDVWSGVDLPKSWTLDYGSDLRGRITGYRLKSGTGPGASELENVTFSWDNTSTGGPKGSLEQISDTTGTLHDYSYQADSWRVQKVSTSLSSVVLREENRAIDLDGKVNGLMTRVQGPSGLEIAASVGYQYDKAHRRMRANYGDGTHWKYGYNDRGEVTSAKRRLSSGNQALAGFQFEYDYDAIGNRTSSKFGGDSAGGNLQSINYVANGKNQYTSITHPGTASVNIQANATSTIELNGSSLTGQGTFFSGQVSATNNANGPEFVSVDVDENSSSIKDEKIWIPKSPMTTPELTYEDGNFKKDGRWIYTWDANNRLRRMKPSTAATTAAQNAGIEALPTLEFLYDWKGRRILKVVDSSSRSFIYDEWNPVGEFENGVSGSIASFQSHLWGIDLSNSLQGAGGVGGLLSTRKVSNPLANNPPTDHHLFPAYDGNGNIIGWIEKTSTTPTQSELVMRTHYDAFGNQVSKQAKSGLAELSFGFSTKYEDVETGLLYYGYRYYDPVTGRWPSRDPIAERGGINLYGMVENDAVNQWDHLGLWGRSRKHWTGKRGKYQGGVCAEKGDTWESLASLFFKPGTLVPHPAGVPEPGKWYPVSPYLIELEKQVRAATVNATSKFVPTFGNGYPRNEKFGSKHINNAFSKDWNGPNLECQCSAVYIMAKGVIDVIGSSDFDGIGYKWNWFKKKEAMMESSPVASVSDMLEGDWGYYRNYANYYKMRGPWQGENIIKVKNGEVWGQGLGSVDEKTLVKELKENNNNTKNPGKFIGFVPDSNYFTNIKKLGVDIFDYRNKRRKNKK